MIGLGSYATQCEYKDIRLTTADGQTQTINVGQFQNRRGEWKVEGDIIRQTSNEQLTMTLLPGFSNDNYTLQLKARKLGGLEGFFIYYGMDENGRNGFAANIAGWNNRTTAIQPILRGRANDVLGHRANQTVETNKWYDVKIVVTPMAVTLYVDGQQMTVARPAAHTTIFGKFGRQFDYEFPPMSFSVMRVKCTLN